MARPFNPVAFARMMAKRTIHLRNWLKRHGKRREDKTDLLRELRKDGLYWLSQYRVKTAVKQLEKGSR